MDEEEMMKSKKRNEHVTQRCVRHDTPVVCQTRRNPIGILPTVRP